jgi:hypothetical protein
VAAQIYRDSAKSLVYEIIQEMGIPTPRAVPPSMDEQQRCWMSVATGSFVDQLEHPNGRRTCGIVD